MSLAAAASVVLPSSLTPQTLALCKSISPSLFPLSSSPLRLHAKPSSLLFHGRSLVLDSSSSRFVLKVAVSADFEEGVVSDDDEGYQQQQSFDPDLKVFVGNLPFNVDSAVLADLFQQAGRVEMSEVIYDKFTSRSRGFGFVTMSTREEAEAAARQLNGYELDGRPLRVNSGPPPPRKEYPSTGRGRADDSNRLYVGNLSWSVDDEALASLFSEQGSVVDAKVVTDRETGRSRGFGFVTYSSAEEVQSAIESLDGASLDGRPIRVSVAEAKQRRQF